MNIFWSYTCFLSGYQRHKGPSTCELVPKLFCEPIHNRFRIVSTPVPTGFTKGNPHMHHGLMLSFVNPGGEIRNMIQFANQFANLLRVVRNRFAGGLHGLCFSKKKNTKKISRMNNGLLHSFGHSATEESLGLSGENYGVQKKPEENAHIHHGLLHPSGCKKCEP